MSIVTVDCIILMFVIVSIVVVYGVYMYHSGVKYGRDHTIIEVLKDNEIIREDNNSVEK